MASDKPRLWVVSELYYPEDTSTGYQMTCIAEGLAGVFDVHVVTGRPNYAARDAKVAARQMHNGVSIRRLWAPRYDKDRLAMRLVSAIVLTCNVFFHLLFVMRRRDRLLAVTNPPLMPIVAGLAARLRGVPAALLVHDLYPEILSAVGFLSPQSVPYRLLARVFAFVFRLFDAIVVLGRDMEEVVRAKLAGGRVPPFTRITNWGDVDEVVPLADNPFRAEHGLAGKFVIQFSGNIGRTHDIESVIGLAERLRDLPQFHVLIAGSGGKQNWAQVQVSQRGLKNVTFLPRQPRERLNQMLCAADVTVIAMVDGMFGLSVPGRMYNVMAAGVPIIAVADPRSELSRTVTENDAGWALSSGDDDGLLRLVLSLGDEAARAEARRRGDNGRRAACEYYTLSRIVTQFRALMLGLAHR